MKSKIDFQSALSLTQTYISKNYSGLLNDRNKTGMLKAYIVKCIRDNNVEVEGLDNDSLADRIVCEMAEYSILTPLLESDDLEEININGWNDIAVTYRSGKIEKLRETFRDRQHAVDIIKRLLNHSGMVIDNATPITLGHLPNNTRITAIKTPVVDQERGISASIRILHPASVSIKQLEESGFATGEMLEFLCMCVRYGVPLVISGATSSGKTTLMNAILETVPDGKRIFTIESGARELSLIREKDGRIANNVVNTLSRPSDNDAYDISQEALVVASLRFNPDIVCIGEMRDAECYAAVEASLTGHTVISTVHSGPGELCHTRIALLCQKRFPIDFGTSLMQAGQAFPIVAYTHKLETNERKCMDISECVVDPVSGKREYRSLYGYRIEKTGSEGGGYFISGRFEKKKRISGGLRDRLLQYGAPLNLLERITEGGGD